MTRSRPTRLAATVAGALALLAACGSPPSSGGSATSSSSATAGSGSSGGSGTTGAAGSATSAAALGGMAGLQKAAKAEGALNVIALPPDWANYKTMIDTFSQKYGIKVTSAQPDAASQDEINAAKQLKGTKRAPDVFDLGLAVALANTSLFAPYQVRTWKDVPAPLKESSGAYVSDYGGYMSIGYDAKKVPAPTQVSDLLDAKFKGKVALNGDPTTAGAAFNGVVATALGTGGSANDIAPGVSFFGKLKKAGNFLPVDPSPATISSGQTPVVFDWDYVNAAQTDKLKGKVDWKVLIPQNAVVGSYYVQAINKGAPHPAAARLWEEFLYSDEGQNIWLKGYARPVRAEAMAKAGTIDKAAYAKLPKAPGKPVFLTTAQTDKATKYLTERWAKTIG